MADVPTSRMWKSRPGLARGLLRVADGGDLRVGEHDARGLVAVGAVLGGRRVAEDVLDRQARLVLAHVGEQDAAVDVADRVQPVVAGDLHVLVDVDVAAGRLEPDRVEPELLGPRVAAERGDELLGVDRRAVVHVDAQRVAVLLDLGRLAAGADVDALLDERVGDLLAGELLLGGEQPPLALDQRHLGAERAVGLRQLGAEHAAAEDHDRRRGSAWRWWPRGWSTARPRAGPRSAGTRRACRRRGSRPCAPRAGRRRRRRASRR